MLRWGASCWFLFPGGSPDWAGDRIRRGGRGLVLVAGVVVESRGATRDQPVGDVDGPRDADLAFVPVRLARSRAGWQVRMAGLRRSARADRKSTRLNSSHA